jgi:hypothetical protein
MRQSKYGVVTALLAGVFSYPLFAVELVLFDGAVLGLYGGADRKTNRRWTPINADKKESVKRAKISTAGRITNEVLRARSGAFRIHGLLRHVRNLSIAVGQ